jgi:hypothetical protein
MERTPSEVRGPFADGEMDRFLDAYFYDRSAFLIDEVRRIDPEANEIDAVTDTSRHLPYAALQRGDPAVHPRHVSGPELLMLTANLGSLHAYFVHGCRWGHGWVGFGNRIHRADVRRLARLGPPLHLHSQELRSRNGASRLVSRYRFRFEQEGSVVYEAVQTAQLFKVGPDER